MNRKKRTTLWIILTCVVVLVAAGVIAVKSYIDGFVGSVASLTVSNVDLSQVPDGTWKGSYSLLPVSVEVGVTVKDHKITAIDLVKHVNGKGQAAESVLEKVVEAQSLEVDTVAGATASSKVILKAIEDALKAR